MSLIFTLSRTVLRVGSIVGAVAMGAIALLWTYQERILFQPKCSFETPDKNPFPFQHPGQQDMDYTDKNLVTKDNVKVHAWLITQKGSAKSSAPTMIFFQGNAGNMGFRLPILRQMYTSVGVNIMAVSYRGYGWSEGAPTERGVYLDAEAALDSLLTEPFIDKKKIFVYGQSVGGAVAIHLASIRPQEVKLVIVENTFTSLLDMVMVLCPFLRPFTFIISFVQRLRMDSLAVVQKLNTPFLVLSGSQDQLVPPAQAQTLYHASVAKTKDSYVVKGGTHNDLPVVGGKLFYEKIASFIEFNLGEEFVSKLSDELLHPNIKERGGGGRTAKDEL